MGTKERREREATERRRAILDAARGLFAEQGYEGTTMPQVAEVAELAAGTLYLYFPGKSALYAELALEAYQRLEDRLREAAAGEGTPRQRAERLGRAFVQFAIDSPADYDMIFFVLQHEAGGWESALDDEQVERLKGHEAASRDLLADVIRPVRAGVDAAELTALANAVWAMMAGVVFYFKDREEFPAVAAVAEALMLKGLFE